MLRTTRTLLAVMLAIGAGISARSQAQTGGSGAVFVMTNAAAKNEIIAYRRGNDGSLQLRASFATGGRGSGGTTDPLGSQGSLTLTQDRAQLLAVNSGSGDISVFSVQGATLFLVDRMPSGGSEPVAVAQHRNLVYVLNAGGSSNVVGFQLANRKLTPIANSIAYLSSGNSGAASLAFSPDGNFLLVTEKINNKIDAFQIQADGTLAPIVVNTSAGPGAFAVVFAPNGTALIAETGPTGGQNASAVSSYSVAADGTLSAINTSVPTLGAATCWIEVTPNGRFVYTANSATSTISGFSIASDGALSPVAGTTVATLASGSTNIDMAISAGGKFLYTLNSGTGTVGIFGINADGTLNSLGEAAGLSIASGFNGLAAK